MMPKYRPLEINTDSAPGVSRQRGKHRHKSRNTITPNTLKGCGDTRRTSTPHITPTHTPQRKATTRKRGVLARVFDWFKGATT